jgi:hypothetical protein
MGSYKHCVISLYIANKDELPVADAIPLFSALAAPSELLAGLLGRSGVSSTSACKTQPYPSLETL